jgi:hypothetical protein
MVDEIMSLPCRLSNRNGARLVLLAPLACVAVLAAAAPASARLFAPAGSGAGQVDVPAGVAVDQSTGLVYVADDFRVDEFTRAGEFVRAFGFGVRTGAHKLEVCTLATGCSRGGPGEPPLNEEPGFVERGGIAVDATTHRVYVGAPIRNRVEEFTEAGAFVTMFGAGVDKGPVHPGDVCSAAFLKEGDVCGAGEKSSTKPGGFGDEGENNETPLSLPIAVDGSGDVWVGDHDRLEKFSAAGVFVEELALPGAAGISSLGLDTLGNFFFLGVVEEAIRKLNGGGTQLFSVDGPPGNPRGLTLGNAEGLYVLDEGIPETAPDRVIRFNSTSGEEEEVFGADSAIGHPNQRRTEAGNGVAFDDTAGTVYVVNSAVVAVAVPAPGPLQRELTSEGVRGTRAKLTALLNAEGAETEYQFEYVDDATFEAEAKGHEFDHASVSPPQNLAASFADTPISFVAEGLTSETGYHFRLVAHNANGNLQTAEGAHGTATFETTSAVEIDAAYVTDVSAESATLNAILNPEGVSSGFHFEYLPAGEYQANVEAGRAPFAGASVAPVPDGSLGSGETPVTVAQTIEGLVPGTTYDFRVVGSNSGGSGASVAKAFSTYATGEATLPDGREWELVSPVEKQGGLFEGIGDQGIQQAAATGGGITYLGTRPTEESPEGYLLKEQILSERTPSGWVSRDLSLPHEKAPGVSIGAGEEYRFFSEDLASGIAQPLGIFDSRVSEDATEDTPLLRGTGAGEGYQPLLVGCPPVGTECPAVVESHADVPPGTKFGIDPVSLQPCTNGKSLVCGVQFVGASSDAKHVILESSAVGLTATSGDNGGLYEWSEGHLTLISRLVNNAPAAFASVGESPTLGRNDTSAIGAVTSDGARVTWAFKGHLYQRNLTTEKTVQIDAPGAGAGLQPANTRPEFQAESANGSVIYFTDEQKLFKAASPAVERPDLYRCVIIEGSGAPKCELSDLAPGAQVQGAVLGSSTDGAYVYFVANLLTEEAHSAGAELGSCENSAHFKSNVECNLYQWHEGTIKFVASVAGEDMPDWRLETSRQTARVSPDGQWLEFMSKRSLTGYENTDARSGNPDEEVFLYDAGAGRLVCVSCSPTGQRPTGAEYGGKPTPSGGDRLWEPTTWIAANVPGWMSYRSGATLYQPRYLTDSGRVFFDSHDNLSTTDTNNAEDVYEFEPAGVGGCTSTNAFYVPAARGCVNLISSGTSPKESAFLDASESGNDVFFLTAAPLSREDTDEAIDVYDAHVCQPSDPCPAPPPVAIEHCTGEACQPQVPGPSEPTIASTLVSGLGNVAPLPETRTKPTPKLTPAQRLKNALKACRRTHAHNAKARRTCEARARKAYRAAIRHGKRARRVP